MSAPKLTKARLGALAVLRQGPAHYSNETSITSDQRNVYWQSADYLIEHQLAWRNETGDIEITEAGHDALRHENAIEFA